MSGSTSYSIKIRDDAHELEWWKAVKSEILNKELLPGTWHCWRFRNFSHWEWSAWKVLLNQFPVKKAENFWIYFRRFLIVSSSLRNFSHHLHLDLLSKFSLPLNYHSRERNFCKLDLLQAKNSSELCAEVIKKRLHFQFLRDNVKGAFHFLFKFIFNFLYSWR